MRQHLQLLRAGWRPRGDRIVKGSTWLPLDERWEISRWMEPLGRAGVRFENGGPDEFVAITPDRSRFAVGRPELVDVLGALHERYVLREYDGLHVSGAVVIDIGAYIGDSAIFFARAGAAKVYAYEPFELTYRAAVRNVQLNGLDGVITLRKLGLGAKPTVVDGAVFASTPMLSTTVDAGANGPQPAVAERVELVTLPSVVGEVRSAHPDSVLVCKMDCEGAEFDVLVAPSVPALRELDQLVVEYHFRSPEPIREVLESAGLTVTDLEDRSRMEAAGRVGMLLATREPRRPGSAP